MVFGSLALLALLGGLIGTLTQAARARVERDFAFRQLSRAEAVNDLNYFVLADAAPSGLPFTAGSLLAQAESIVERDRISAPPDRVELFLSLGRQYSLHEEEAKARRLLEQAYAMSRGPPTLLRAKAACALGAHVARPGELDRGERLFARVSIGCPPSPDSRSTGSTAPPGQRGSRARNEMASPPNTGGRGAAVPGAPFPGAIPRAPPPAHAWPPCTMGGRPGCERGVPARRGTVRGAGARPDGVGRDPLQQLGAHAPHRRPAAPGRIAVPPRDGDRPGRHGTVRRRPMLLANYASSLTELGRLEEARGYAERALASSAAGDEFVVSIALRLQTLIWTALGDADRAGRFLAELEPRLKSYEPRHPAHMHRQHARSAYLLVAGDTAGALATADCAVALARELPGSAIPAAHAAAPGRDRAGCRP